MKPFNLQSIPGLAACLKHLALEAKDGVLQHWLESARTGLSPFHSWPTLQTMQRPPLPWEQGYLPIETFRLNPKRFFLGASIAREFASSGTTGSERARSLFSDGGLKAYQAQSLYTFYSVLVQVMGPALGQGISLVPPASTWPHSSLAQMVGWIHDITPLRYSSGSELQAKIPRDGPVWIIGTAFDYINLMDAGEALPLPPGSIIIETGGTKGKSREVPRDEFYQLLSQHFAVLESSIISEYGMSELACQAYDFVPKGHSTPLPDRYFRFPSWVKPSTFGGNPGPLIIDDPLRVDMPWPVCTQDRARLLEAHAFQLLGRMPLSPLKGCSLNAETVVSQTRPEALTVRPSVTVPLRSPGLPADFNERLLVVTTVLTDCLDDPRILTAFTQEFGHEVLATWAIADLKYSMPKGREGWVKAALTAAGDSPIAQNWLFILPENHSVVGIYPIALAMLLGLNLTVRLPDCFTKSPVATMLAKLTTHYPVALLNSSFKLNSDSPPFNGSMLVYGTDKTIEYLNTLNTNHVQGFGERATVSLITGDDLKAMDKLAILKEHLSLAGQGCLTSRCLIILDPEKRWTKALLPKVFFDAIQPVNIKVPEPNYAQNQDAWHHILAGATVHQSGLTVSLYQNPSELPSAQSSWSLPIAWYTDTRRIDQMLTRLMPRKAVLASPSVKALSPLWETLGAGHHPPWNGLHDGKPLFVIS